MKLSLEVLTDGKQKGKQLPINLPQFVIGRDPQCHLRPASPSISKRHCALLQRDNHAFVRDFDSTNGTFLNEQPVKGEQELKHGDELRIGPIKFTVCLQLDTPVNTPTPAPPTKNTPPPAIAKKAAPPTGDSTPLPKMKPAAPAPSAPPKKSAPAMKHDDSQDDVDISAMLSDMSDDSSAGALDDGGGIPDGSTVMDLMIPPGALDPAQAKKDKEKEKPKPPANTQSAAQDILAKYMKRPR